MNFCKVSGCSREASAGFDMCLSHRKRVWRTGDPQAHIPIVTRGYALKFAREAAASREKECIVWPYAKNDKGYGTINYKGRSWGAHRLILVLASGTNPEGLEAAHGPCNRRDCVNPNHLSWKTHAENVKDKIADGTTNRGAKAPNNILSADQVLLIRESSLPHKVLAERYGVARKTISNIRCGENWEWLS